MTVLIWTDDAGGTVSVRFDTVNTETHDSTSVITEHPVEKGSNVSDHIRPELDRLSVEGYVSNKPLATNPDVDQFAGYSPITLPDGTTATVLAPRETRDRVRDTFELLQDAQKNSRIVRVETKIREYEDMGIERVSTPRTVEDGSGATFQVDLKHMKFVSAETVDAPEPAEVRGQAKKAVGSKHAEEDPEDVAKKKKSILANGLDSLLGND